MRAKGCLEPGVPVEGSGPILPYDTKRQQGRWGGGVRVEPVVKSQIACSYLLHGKLQVSRSLGGTGVGHRIHPIQLPPGNPHVPGLFTPEEPEC